MKKWLVEVRKGCRIKKQKGGNDGKSVRKKLSGVEKGLIGWMDVLDGNLRRLG